MNEKELKKSLQRNLKKPAAMNFNHVVLQEAGVKPRAQKKESFHNGNIVAGFLLATLGSGFSTFLPVSEESGLVLKILVVLIPLGFIAYNLISRQIIHINEKSK